MLKRTLKRGVIGLLIGMAAGVLVSCLIVIATKGGGTIISQKIMDMCGDEAHALLLIMGLSGIMGFFDCAGMTFYEMENWSLIRILACHLGVIFATFLPVAYILDWFDSLAGLLIICGFMLAGYFIVWLIMCAVYKRQVKELNEMQNRKK